MDGVDKAAPVLERRFRLTSLRIPDRERVVFAVSRPDSGMSADLS